MAVMMMTQQHQVTANVNPEQLEMILKTYFHLFKSFASNTSNADFKQMANKVSKYLWKSWAALTQEAKEILVFPVIAVFELQGIQAPFLD